MMFILGTLLTYIVMTLRSQLKRKVRSPALMLALGVCFGGLGVGVWHQIWSRRAIKALATAQAK